jgi:hypothetical protein
MKRRVGLLGIAVIPLLALTGCGAASTTTFHVQPVNHLQLEKAGGTSVTMGVGFDPLFWVDADSLLLQLRGSSTRTCAPLISQAVIVDQKLEVTLEPDRPGPCTADAVPYTFRLLPTAFSGHYGEVDTHQILENAATNGVVRIPRRSEPFPVNFLRRHNTGPMVPADAVIELPTEVG